ncbi:hypothetical protein PoB_004754800 [Plakobranchus ocellatus]|uniref:Uncharacterized protein n=1 Tax=Plakobranchus ocellatus TaxID=259542 RepID=A0AAV4BQH7_9GAST|nr:hypothetical protein PoB_004754800 [Plakobranchus ocellatus]
MRIEKQQHKEIGWNEEVKGQHEERSGKAARVMSSKGNTMLSGLMKREGVQRRMREEKKDGGVEGWKCRNKIGWEERERDMKRIRCDGRIQRERQSRREGKRVE